MTFLIILIAFVSLLGLMILHEFGHFILAKKFGVKVEEFGIGLPPRIFGKKFGETTYSINALPLGAFVKLLGEDEKLENNASFSQKPIWQRALIIFGGVMSFWIISIIILSIIAGIGAPMAISDSENGNLVNPRVQIAVVSPKSPAEAAGLKAGDSITNFTKVQEMQDFTVANKGKEIILKVERGDKALDIAITPRVSPPNGEGPLGVALVRTAIKSYPWYEAPWQGIQSVADLTVGVVLGWGQALQGLIQGTPSGVQLMGPVGIFSLFTQVGQLGVVYFIHFVAVISIYLALFNILPIPSVDGGKLLFLAIEAVRRKPVNQKIEQIITAGFFSLLVALMIFVTIKDVIKLF